MDKRKSAFVTATLANSLTFKELQLSRHSDKWWALFWHYVGLLEAKRVKERIENENKHG